MRRRGARTTAVCVALAALIAGGLAVGAPDEDLDTRMFRIRFKPVEDVVLLIEPHISDRGSYTVQPRLRAITVRDEAPTLTRISELIADYDQPPRSVRLVIQLLRATEADPASARRGSDATGVPSLLRDVTKWSEVSPMGSASIVGVEGAQSTLNIGDEFRVRVRVDTVAERQGVVRFDRFALERVVRDADGSARYVPIWDTAINLRNNQQLLMGATSSVESRRAIFLSVTATIEPAGRPVRNE